MTCFNYPDLFSSFILFFLLPAFAWGLDGRYEEKDFGKNLQSRLHVRNINHQEIILLLRKLLNSRPSLTQVPAWGARVLIIMSEFTI